MNYVVSVFVHKIYYFDINVFLSYPKIFIYKKYRCLRCNRDLKSRCFNNINLNVKIYFGSEFSSVRVFFFVSLNKMVIIAPFMPVLNMVFSGNMDIPVSEKRRKYISKEVIEKHRNTSTISVSFQHIKIIK